MTSNTPQVPAYLHNSKGSHMSLYWKNVTGASLALFVDFMAFYVLDYCLQGRFWSYGWKVLPFKRDTKYFTDYMSETFPPFVTCEVSVHLLAYVFFFVLVF